MKRASALMLFYFYNCFQHGRHLLKRTAMGPCDKIGLPCDVDCSGECEEKTISCYNSECAIEDTEAYKRKRSVFLTSEY